jgi:uncharacterized protein YcbX
VPLSTILPAAVPDVSVPMAEGPSGPELTTPLGRVAALRRYPIKSLVGEALEAVEVQRRGLADDRRWAVTDLDGKLGSGKSTRRFRRMPGLLDLVASLGEGAVPVVGFPDGRRLAADDPDLDQALTAHVGRPVKLRQEDGVSHLDDGPVHLLTTASLRALADHVGRPVDLARFRPNLLVESPAEGYVEDAWVGHRLALGTDVVLAVRAPMPRCVTVGLAQRDLPAAPGLLEALARVHDACLGVVADVVRPGRLRVGDEVRLVS